VPRPADGRVLSVNAERKHQRPRPPFEASSWLQVAARTLRLSVKDATRATQELFEAGSTTYPRTDTVRVADEAVTWVREEIERRFGRAYVPDKPWVHNDRGAALVQGAHEAIRPTTPHGEPLDSRRRGQWGEAYALIEARFLASQAAARVVEKTSVKIEAGPLSFIAHGEVELFDGWRRVLAGPTEEDAATGSGPESQEDNRDDGDHLPVLAEAERLTVSALEVGAHTTRPKPLFDQASLVAELKRLGIGRPSTYQTVVPLLLSRGWVTEQRQVEARAKGSKAAPLPVLAPSAAGADLSDFLLQALPGLVDYEFTASMERALDEIESGKRRRVDVARDWWARFERELAAAKAIKPCLPERKDLGPCPSCAKAGRSGRLRLIQGVSPETKKPYEFAGCDADSREVRACGHKAQVKDGRLLPSPPCSQCAVPLRAVSRKDGGHSWRCEEHGWFLAGRKWELVTAPKCPECSAPMVHRERRDPKGEFFWACFSHKVFLPSDRFGSVEKRRRGT
jgi:DNA topoisomerase-1